MFVIFDVKIIDPQQHKLATGGTNRQILQKAQKLVAAHFPVEFRMPLVAGYTDTAENIHATIQWLQAQGQRKIHLLQYHKMGESKIDLILGQQAKLHLPNYPEPQFHKIKATFQQAGIEVGP